MSNHKAMNRIKTWRERCETHPDHNGIVSDGMIQARMQEEIDELRQAIEQTQPVAWYVRFDNGRVDLLAAPISENRRAMWESAGKRFTVTPLYTAPRQWQGLTDKEVKPPIQRAMQHFGFDPTQYSLGGAATIGFLGLVRDIEAKLKGKNA